MRLDKKAIGEKDGGGYAVVVPEVDEDLWHAYNLICVGDQVRTSTLRKVVKEGLGGSTQSKRVSTQLTLEVEAIHFDPSAPSLQLRGKNVAENKHVRMGAYHTLEIEFHRAFRLTKTCWDAVYLERLETATDVAANADVAAVCMGNGTAQVCLMSGHMTTVRAKIDGTIPKKRPGSSGHSKGLRNFYRAVLAAVDRHVDFSVVKTLIIASPGFVREDFFKFILEEAVKLDMRKILDNKDRIMLVHTTEGNSRALQEVLQDPSVTAKLADTKAVGEARALERFHELLRTDPDRAFYGVKHVTKAIEGEAVETLLVTDALFRAASVAQRKLYVGLVEAARAMGAEVLIFSALHSTGERLHQMTGLAAILRFPMPDIVLGDSDDDSSDDSDSDSDTDSDAGGGSASGGGAASGAGAGSGGRSSATRSLSMSPPPLPDSRAGAAAAAGAGAAATAGAGSGGASRPLTALEAASVPVGLRPPGLPRVPARGSGEGGSGSGEEGEEGSRGAADYFTPGAAAAAAGQSTGHALGGGVDGGSGEGTDADADSAAADIADMGL